MTPAKPVRIERLKIAGESNRARRALVLGVQMKVDESTPVERLRIHEKLLDARASAAHALGRTEKAKLLEARRDNARKILAAK